LRATTDTAAAMEEVNTVVLIVPVLVDATGRVDFRSLDAATGAIGEGLHRRQLVILETTVPVGTTRSRVASILYDRSGLHAGNDYALAFSPERVYAGRIFADLRNYRKVVGGVDEVSTARAAAFYRAMLGASVLEMPNAETAEFVKLAETTYRNVNIALANEFACFAELHGIDAAVAFAAANTQPFSHIHAPGLGVGGHCIPVYPYFLANAWSGMQLVPIARRINDGMAAHGVELLRRALGSLAGARVLILGLSYRENVRETAFTSAARLIAALRDADAAPLLHDSLYTDDEIRAFGAEPVALEPRPRVDAIIVQAAHHAFEGLRYDSFPGVRAVLDGRSALTNAQRAVLEAAGITYLRIGLGTVVSRLPGHITGTG
jgi:nucleotide sugar dehydrogenase